MTKRLIERGALAKNDYETSWVEALVQSYGGFWPWSLRIHPPQHENAFRGVGVARGAPRGRISAKKHPQKSKMGTNVLGKGSSTKL